MPSVTPEKWNSDRIEWEIRFTFSTNTCQLRALTQFAMAACPEPVQCTNSLSSWLSTGSSSSNPSPNDGRRPRLHSKLMPRKANTKWRKYTEAPGNTSGFDSHVSALAVPCFAVKCKWAGSIFLGHHRIGEISERKSQPHMRHMRNVCDARTWFQYGDCRPKCNFEMLQNAPWESPLWFLVLLKKRPSHSGRVKNGQEWWENVWATLCWSGVAAGSWPSHMGKINCF